MNAENEKRQQTDEAKGETGAMWAAVHLRQGVGVAALSLSPSHPTHSLFFIYLFPSIYLFSPLEGPQPNKEHWPQDIEGMLLRETILFPMEY